MSPGSDGEFWKNDLKPGDIVKFCSNRMAELSDWNGAILRIVSISKKNAPYQVCDSNNTTHPRVWTTNIAECIPISCPESLLRWVDSQGQLTLLLECLELINRPVFDAFSEQFL